MIDWREVLLSSHKTIESAVEILEKIELRIVLVVDESGVLQGTITDGDIRRGLIRHLDLDTNVSEVMRSDPKTASKDDSRHTMLAIMKKNNIFHLPLLDEHGVVIGLETLRNLNDKPLFDNPVFLMAGGFGKRLLPLTISTPKPLLKVGDKPILQNILENFISNGFHNFYIATHYKADQVMSHFGNGEKWDVKIKYVHEETPLGTAGALGLLPDNLLKKPLILMNGDLLTKANYEHLLRFHIKSGGVCTMCVREYDYQLPYGVVKANGLRIKEIVEKPVHKFFINAGIYVLNPSVFENMDGKYIIDMPDLLQGEIQKGEKISMYPLHEYWLDIGRMEDYENAQIYNDENDI